MNDEVKNPIPQAGRFIILSPELNPGVPSHRWGTVLPVGVLQTLDPFTAHYMPLESPTTHKGRRVDFADVLNVHRRSAYVVNDQGLAFIGSALRYCVVNGCPWEYIDE